MINEFQPQMSSRSKIEVQTGIYKYQTTYSNPMMSSFYANQEKPQLKRKMMISNTSNKNLKNDLRRRSEITNRSK